ncbi:13028_t:CDS:2 [Funneliformis geosporum]|nr:13028_t:CDS:2 [Funneliformis geosporum]
MTVKIWYKIEELEETSINFEQNKTVDDLKKAIIKNEPSVLKDCTSSEINLKITKDGDSKIHIVSPRWIIQKVLQEHGNDFLCLICKKEFMRKRKATEVQDVSAQVLDVFNKRHRVMLPKVDELADFLEQPLLDNMKIPILQHEYNSYLVQGMENTCTPEDLNILFRISDTEDAYEFITKTLSAPIRNNPPSREGTEYSFVSFWDINIRFPLEQFIPDGISIRNSSQKMSTFGKRPDFGFILNHVCPFRGVEKSLINNDDPKAELRDKLFWTYDPAPYVLGYYANGPEVTFVSICRPSSGDNPDVINIVKSNLNLRKDRILNMRRMINLSILIKSLQDVIGWHETPEFRPIEREDQTVEVCATNIKKTFTNPEKSDARVEKLKNVYDILTKKKVPNVDRLIHADNESGVVYLGPKGMSVKPKNQKELIEAVFCVLETLVVLHDGDEPIFHQDIRWPNIIKLPGEQSKWILIDWDDADGPPTRPVSHLGKENHAPEVFKEGHGGEVDIWSVGKLITDANNWIIGISQDIIEFGVQMQSNRPSAHDALELFRPFTQ